MTAYDAFVEILEINETIDALKEKNNDTVPDMVLCQSIRLLTSYRDLLGKALQKLSILGDE